MENEHINQFDSDQTFVTTNYEITTTPRNEWSVVLLCDESRADMREHRRIPKICDLMALQISKDSQLEETEVIAVVMYTGPMASDLLKQSTYLNSNFNFLMLACTGGVGWNSSKSITQYFAAGPRRGLMSWRQVETSIQPQSLFLCQLSSRSHER